MLFAEMQTINIYCAYMHTHSLDVGLLKEIGY